MPEKCTNIHHRGTVSAISFFSLFLAVFLCLFSFVQKCSADYMWSGDVVPDDPATWTEITYAHVGKTSDGTVIVDGGSDISSSRGYIGYDPNSTGTVTIDGSDSTWTNHHYFYVGYFGSGKMNISGGAVVNTVTSNFFTNFYGSHIGYATGSRGSVIVDGVGSKWKIKCNLHIGSGPSIGTLDISGGGEVSNYYGHIGGYSGSTGAVTVDGSGSRWTNNANLYVGESGNGTLDISGGAICHNKLSSVGHHSGSTGAATIDGVGSTWSNSYFLHVGDYGSGTLHISGGGVATNISGAIGQYSGSTGTVAVDGPGSMWTNSDKLCIGNGGNGTLHISGGGEVRCNSSSIGYQSSSAGTVTINGLGSTWTTSDELFVGKYGSGTLHISDGATVSVGGVLTIDESGGEDSFINMSTGGMLALHGKAVGSIAEFLDLIEGTDAIRYWDNSTSNWANIIEATLGVDCILRYQTEDDLAGYTILTVISTMGGDANRDGSVDVSDLGILATNYDQGGGFEWEQGDFTGDGFVDASDLGILATNYGTGTAAAVPEPGALLLLCGIFCFTCSRRCK